MRPRLSQSNYLDRRIQIPVDEARNDGQWLLPDFVKVQSSCRTKIRAVRFVPLRDPIFAERAFPDNSFRVDVLWSVVRTCPRTISASDAGVLSVIDRLMDFVPGKGPRGTTLKAERNGAVVAG